MVFKERRQNYRVACTVMFLYPYLLQKVKGQTKWRHIFISNKLFYFELINFWICKVREHTQEEHSDIVTWASYYLMRSQSKWNSCAVTTPVTSKVIIAIMLNGVQMITKWRYFSGHVHIMTGTARTENGKIEIILETELVEGHPLPMKPKIIRVSYEYIYEI